MGISLSAQSSSLALSLLLGLCTAILYDGLRSLRLRRRRSHTWRSLLDGVFCAALVVLYFGFSLRIGGGELRLYMLLFSFTGFSLYFLLLSPVLQNFWQFWADVFFEFARLLLLPFRCAKIFYGKLTKLCKRLFLFLHRRFIMKLYRRTGKGRRGRDGKQTGEAQPAHSAGAVAPARPRGHTASADAGKN